MRILHLAGLKIDGSFDNGLYIDPLLKTLEEEVDKGRTIDAVLISGGLVALGKKANYDLASAFLEKLMRACDLKGDRIFIIPGIEDYKMPVEENSQQVPKILSAYPKFIGENFPHLLSLERPGNTPFVKDFPEGNLMIIGLDLFSDEINLRLPQMSKNTLPIFLTCFPVEFIPKTVKRKIYEWSGKAIMLGAWTGFDSYADDVKNLQTGQIYPGCDGYKGRFQTLNFDVRGGFVDIKFFSYNHRSGQWHMAGEEGHDGRLSIRIA